MITSASNGQIKNIIQLLKSSKDRKRDGLFVVEGIKMVREAPFLRVRSVYMSESFANSHTDEFSKYVPEIVSDAVYKKMSDTATPQGIMCVVEIDDVSIDDLLKRVSTASDSIKIMILDTLQDPGNLGTILRTAEAAGFDAIIANDKTVDVYNPKVIRSTMGAIFRVPVIYVDDLPVTIDKLKSVGIKMFAAHLRGDKYFNETDYGNRVGIMIGNESNGLSDEVSSMSDELVKIPMYGEVESLNAAVAASLFMYETVHP